MDRLHLLAQLSQYGSSHPEELLFVAQFKSLLKNPRCFHRDHLPGHLTGSAWITNPWHSKIVLVHHAKLNKWLQPGGHADGEEDMRSVAIRELEEETGLRLNPVQDSLFDIDIHLIPAQADFPAHYHYDIRFLFVAHESEHLKINQESKDIQWITLLDIPSFNREKSILRMRDKLEKRKAIWN